MEYNTRYVSENHLPCLLKHHANCFSRHTSGETTLTMHIVDLPLEPKIYLLVCFVSLTLYMVEILGFAQYLCCSVLRLYSYKQMNKAATEIYWALLDLGEK